jgi:hypothetical protein
MSGEQPAVEAVRAATGRVDEPMQIEGRTIVHGKGGAAWRVGPAALEGLGEGGCPEVIIVAPLHTDDPDAPVWVARLPSKGMVRVDSDEALAALFQACPYLPPETIARLVAINRGPRGAERALFEDEEIDSLLAELAPSVSAPDRALVFARDSVGGWNLGFLAALLRQSPVDRTFRLTVARWSASFESGVLTWGRRELLTDALLERYRI